MATKRQIFYSFHFDNDVFRVQTIRNIGALEDNKPVAPNEWEEVKRRGDNAIEKWIDDNMKYRSCVVVLVGEKTYERPWVRYEIKKAWNDGKGLLGIYVHNFKCAKTIKGNPSLSGKCSQGTNPFSKFALDGKNMSELIPCYNPDPNDPYKTVKENLESWVEKAIQLRTNYKK